MPDTGRVALFHGPAKPFEIREMPVPDPEPGAMLIKVSMANICGSDLHAWHGRFVLAGLGGVLPTVLGHEMTGVVTALGQGLTRDADGLPLAEGDRVTFTYFTGCGQCYGCLRGKRTSCSNLSMPMTQSAEAWPHFVGAYGDYFYVRPNAAIYKVPEGVPDEVVAGANCALSQVIAGFERCALRFDEAVVIQGAGGLGLYATAVAKAFGARMVVTVDAVADRLEMASRFGADATININELPDPKARAKQIKHLTDGRGADVVMEVVGAAAVVPEGIRMLAQHGRYVGIGCINAGQTYEADPSRLVMANKSFIGVALYEPDVLGKALRFLSRYREQLPLDELVSRKFPLTEIDDAFRKADQREVLRASLVPH
jgi:D-arabinose 1-dehydrogenase-like Zn-dependent alcohol dehydrogenase